MDGLKGALLGAVNVVVVAIGLAGLEHEAGVVLLVIMMGMMPGVLTGMMLGAIARRMRSSPVASRLAILVSIPVIVVFVLADAFGMTGAALVSCIPTCVAALILERWTRAPEAEPPVPVAAVRR